MARKSWQEKLYDGREPHIEVATKKFADIQPDTPFLIPTGLQVLDYINSIPKGTSTTVLQMRKDLGAQYNVETACPLVSGIMLRVVAEAAYEAYSNGKAIKSIAPFWRIMPPKAPVIKKLSFGSDFVTEQRLKEKLPV
ncbi:MAG: hypothetical protein RL660_92 [Bacteroidota bacterium]|jgi:hypothetical protein